MANCFRFTEDHDPAASSRVRVPETITRATYALAVLDTAEPPSRDCRAVLLLVLQHTFAISPNYGIAPHDGVAPDDGVAPNHGVPPDDGVTPNHRVAPADRSTPDYGIPPDRRGIVDDGDCVGPGVVLRRGGFRRAESRWREVGVGERRRRIHGTRAYGEDVFLNRVGDARVEIGGSNV